jgi:hypothetical protein
LYHRQIRNAFQTAIALVEYEARQSGAELPSLGKAQFEIIAEASEEFDRYLKNTLGAVDADLARREQTRFDRFISPATNKTQPSITKQAPSRSPRRNAKDPESEVEEDTIDESEEEDEDEEEEEEEDATNVHRPAKTTLSVPSVAGSSMSAKDPIDEEYEEFLRFQQMKKNKGKK